MQTLRSEYPENAASSYNIAHFRLDFGSEQSVSSGVKGAAMDAAILANTPDDASCLLRKRVDNARTGARILMNLICRQQAQSISISPPRQRLWPPRGCGCGGMYRHKQEIQRVKQRNGKQQKPASVRQTREREDTRKAAEFVPEAAIILRRRSRGGNHQNDWLG